MKKTFKCRLYSEWSHMLRRLVRLGAGLTLGLCALLSAILTSPTSVAAQATPTATPTATSSDPAVIGQWSQTYTWPEIAVHMAVFPDGRVISFTDPSYNNGHTPASAWIVPIRSEEHT